ncbi:TIGR02301 family protein [Ancylobacter terrae]|uniref:TIGR02301 family protein n=1 Tax=Ancylobacter sp. sgz301288 TaxID=3342077 RepID=UPI00385A91B7
MRPILLAAVLFLVPLADAAQAQQTEGAPPPYEAEMSQLAELMGALHYLRPLCGAKEGNRWRDEMQALIDAEQPSEARRSRLIAAFNRGYTSYQQVYRTCTPSAELAGRRYLDEGARLSRDIATRYGSN